MKKYDLHGAAGALIRDKKVLLARAKDKSVFTLPGGTVKSGESSKHTAIREIFEEVKVIINEHELDELGTFYAAAAGQEDKSVRMDMFIVKNWTGEPVPNDGDEVIEEIIWVDSSLPDNLNIGSIFKHKVLPNLKKLGLVS